MLEPIDQDGRLPRLRTRAGRPSTRRRVGTIVRLAAVSCMLAIAGCGSSSASSSGTTRASSDPQLALAQCMRAHGVPNFPDPTKGPGGEGFSISMTPGSSSLTVDGIPFSGPALQSAVKACKLFGGGGAPPPVSEAQKVALFTFARCMRTHGVPSYPDPAFPAGGGIERALPPSLNPRSPAFTRAWAACALGGTCNGPVQAAVARARR